MREKYRKLKALEKEILETFDELLEFWKMECEECEILKSDKKELEYEVECLKSDKEELEYEVEILKEKIEIIERDRDDNYRPIPISEQLDISDRDFL